MRARLHLEMVPAAGRGRAPRGWGCPLACRVWSPHTPLFPALLPVTPSGTGTKCRLSSMSRFVVHTRRTGFRATRPSQGTQFRPQPLPCCPGPRSGWPGPTGGASCQKPAPRGRVSVDLVSVRPIDGWDFPRKAVGLPVLGVVLGKWFGRRTPRRAGTRTGASRRRRKWPRTRTTARLRRVVCLHTFPRCVLCAGCRTPPWGGTGVSG